jgi:hypothetical protein
MSTCNNPPHKKTKSRTTFLSNSRPSPHATAHLLSDSSSSDSAAVWNLLSHMYREVLMGLNGSKSMLT